MKKASTNSTTIKFYPSFTATLLFFVLLGIALVLFFGRKESSLQFNVFLEFMPTFYQHISNYSLSYILYAGIGYLWLMFGVPFRFVVLLGLTFIVANFITELYIPILNTPDRIDAYFGWVGTAIGFLFLSYVRYFGLKSEEKSDNNTRHSKGNPT